MNEFEEKPPEVTTQATRKEEIKAIEELVPRISLPDNISAINHDIENDDVKKSAVAEAVSSSNNNDAIETVNTKNQIIQINIQKLKEIKEKYGISDWDVQVDPKFSFNPSMAIWKTKTVVIRPFNFWSYLAVGSSVEKRNQVLPRLLAHELRHSQQERPASGLKGYLHSARYAYWFHPQETDARKWAVEHAEEFQDTLTINSRH
jgi:hypothetical protein